MADVSLLWLDRDGDASREQPEGDGTRSVSDEVHERDREGSSSHRVAFDVAQLWRRAEATSEDERRQLQL